jgi:hypothetical protein
LLYKGHDTHERKVMSDPELMPGRGANPPDWPTLGTTEAAVKMTVLRFRRRYSQLLRREIAHTIASPDEVEEEMRHLFVVVAA